MKNIFSVEFFIKKNGAHGSVTIFLTMILLPMLLLMVTLTDYAKIMVARRQVSGAGDMALSAGLSYYDEYLKDMYGLFAVSKDTKDLQAGLEEYFTNTLLGEGLDVDSPFLQEIKNIFAGSVSEEDAYLKLINLQKHSFTVSDVEGANFANATLLNNQIMDYMEFRGPVVLATGILDKIGAFKELNKEKDAAKKKVQFEKKLEKAEDVCKKAYEKINKYNEAVDTLDVNKLKGLIDNANSYYKEAVRYIFLIQENVNAEPKKKEKEKVSKSADEVYNYLVTNFSENSDYMKRIKKLENTPYGNNAYEKALYLYYYNDAVKSYNSENIEGYGERLNNCISEKMEECNNNIEYYKDKVKENKNEIIRIIKEDLDLKNLESTVYKSLLLDFIEGYEKFLNKKEDAVKESINEIKNAAKEYYKEDVYNDKNIEEILNILREEVGRWVNNKKAKENSDEAIKKMSAYDDVLKKYDKYKAYFSNVGQYYDAAHNIYDGRKDLVNSEVNKGNDEIKKLENIIKDVRNVLEDAIKAVGNVIKKFEELENFRDGEWQPAVNNLSGESKTNMQSDLEEEAGNIDSKSAKKCKKDLEKAKEKLEDLHDKVKEISFKKSEAKDEAKKSKSDIYTKLADIEAKRDKADNYFANNAKIDNSFITESTIPKKITAENNDFYKYLKKIDSKDEKVDNNEKEDAKKLKDNLLKNNSNPDNGISGASDDAVSSGSTDMADDNTRKDESLEDIYTDPVLPSKGKAGAEESVKKTEVNASVDDSSLDGDSTIMNLLSKGFEIAEKGVEDIYLTEYIMNMFTYRTYDRNQDGTQITSDLKSLSGYTYNTKSPLYAAEAEYTLWGMNTAKANLDATYAAIFSIRFLMNAIYALTNSEINAQTRAAAIAIVGFTGFGVPIMKTVLDLGLALLETVMDMRMLIQGRPVAIYKNRDTWVCSLNGMKNAVVTEVKIKAAQKASELANKAIDKLQTCAVDKLDEVADELTKNLTQQASSAVNTIVSTIIKRVEERLSAVSIENCVSDDEIKEGVGSWVKDFKIKLGVPDSLPDKENVTDYVLYIAYEKISTEEFKNEMSDKIIEIQNKITESANIKVSEYSKKVSEFVEKILGVEKVKDANGNEKYTKIFDVDYNEIIKGAISKASEYIKNAAIEGTEAAREKINKKISEYSENLLSSKSNTGLNKSATGNTVTKSSSAAMTMDYKEYLTMFILLTGIDTEKYDKHVLRVSDLIQINVGQAKKDDGFDSKFAMAKCKTHLKAEAAVSGNTFFAGTAYLKNTENNIYLKDSNGMYGIKYVGVDGY